MRKEFHFMAEALSVKKMGSTKQLYKKLLLFCLGFLKDGNEDFFRQFE